MKNIGIEERISASRQLMCNPYAYLDDLGEFSASELNVTNLEALRKDKFVKQNPYAHNMDLESNSDKALGVSSQFSYKFPFPHKDSSGRIKDSDIERLVDLVKGTIWANRQKLWNDNLPKDPVELLDPEIALNMIGFNVEHSESLGEFEYRGQLYDVSGQIDREGNKVTISKREPLISRRFTLAHELGHALMHHQTGLHRDPPPNNRADYQREPLEREADKFAAYFLMPKKLVLKEFVDIFMVEKFAITENRRYALNPSNDVKIEKHISTRRGLARHLAGASSYNGEHFQSLADRFIVSIESMAIRLEELEIV